MNIISRLLGGSDTNPKFIKTTATKPYRVSRPVAGFVCLGPELQSLMETDKSTLGPFFSEVRSSSQGIVPCHVLFLYCKVDKDGSLPGSKMRVRDYVRASGACVAIVASENDGSHYMHALQPKNDWPANIVLVINRRGTAFTVFFQKLFEAMKGGASMLMAWVKLAPQTPNRDHPECPSTLMLAEAGHGSQRLSWDNFSRFHVRPCQNMPMDTPHRPLHRVHGGIFAEFVAVTSEPTSDLRIPGNISA